MSCGRGRWCSQGRYSCQNTKWDKKQKLYFASCYTYRWFEVRWYDHRSAFDTCYEDSRCRQEKWTMLWMWRIFYTTCISYKTVNEWQQRVVIQYDTTNSMFPFLLATPDYLNWTKNKILCAEPNVILFTFYFESTYIIMNRGVMIWYHVLINPRVTPNSSNRHYL